MANTRRKMWAAHLPRIYLRGYYLPPLRGWSLMPYAYVVRSTFFELRRRLATRTAGGGCPHMS